MINEQGNGVKYKVRGSGSEELVLSLKTLIEACESFKSKL